MKKLTSILLAASLCLIAGGFSGCATNPAIDKTALMQYTAQNAVYTGSFIWLNGLGDGTKIRPHLEDKENFQLAADSLRALVATGEFNLAALTGALDKLPVKEFQGTDGKLIVGNVFSFWDTFGRQIGQLDQSTAFREYLLPVSKSILTGLDLAIAQTP